MKFTYLRTPLHRYTFRNKKIKNWVELNAKGKVLNLFSGEVKLNCNEVRNDLDINALADYHKDALEFCNTWEGDNFDTVILDPPYSYRKSMELYNGKITSPFNALKDALLRILNPEGTIITFGYHSNVMGSKRGFTQEEILLISHGGAIHDTIAVVEKRRKPLPGWQRRKV